MAELTKMKYNLCRLGTPNFQGSRFWEVLFLSGWGMKEKVHLSGCEVEKFDIVT